MGLEPGLRCRAIGGDDIDRQANILREGCLRPHRLTERRGDDADEGDLLGPGRGGGIPFEDKPLAIADKLDRDRLRLHDLGRGVVGKGDRSDARRNGREKKQVRPFHGTTLQKETGIERKR